MVAPKNSASAVNLSAEPPAEGRKSVNKMLPPSKSTESLYSTSSSKYSASALYNKHRSNVSGNGHRSGNRQSTFLPASTEVRQRVLSARRLRMKSLQNQLTDALKHIGELTHENRILQTMHKRQDSALAKYESSNAELPQLLHSHAEEVRIWQAKWRNLQSQNKEMANKLKQKELIILTLSDQNRYLSQLTKNKNLEDRQRLTERCHKLENQLQEKDNDLKLMARRLQLESKSLKMQMQNEHKKYKFAMSKFDKARNELAIYTKLEDLNENEKLGKASNSGFKSDPNDSGLELKQKDEIKTNLKSVKKDVPAISKANIYSSIPSKNTKSLKNDDNKSLTKVSGSMQQRLKYYSENDEVAKAIQKSIDSFGHIGQGDGNLGDNDRDDDDSETDEIAKKILLSDDVEKEKTKIKCPYLDKIQDYDDQYDDDYEEDGEVDVEDEYENNNENEDNEGNDDNEDNDDNEYNEDNEDNVDNEQDVICSTDNLNNKPDIEIKNIHRKISEDYKEREFYLDSYCRESKSNNVDGKPTTVDSKRKGKLLAALRAIDDDKKK